MKYEHFKRLTIDADETITKAEAMRAVSDDFANGFHKAMWEAREIFMRLEDEDTVATPNKDNNLIDGGEK